MSRVYTVSFENISVTASQDLFELTAASNKPIEVLSIAIDQISDVGDAQEEMLRIKLIRGHTTSGSGGAVVTPRSVKVTASTAGFTAERNNTTIASAGTAVDLFARAFNIRAGFEKVFDEGAEPSTSGTALMVLRLMAAPADAVTLSGTMEIREYG